MTKHEIIVQMRKDIENITKEGYMSPNLFRVIVEDYIKFLNELK